MLCEPVAMASVFRTPVISQSSPCCYQQHGARLPYSCQKSYLKLPNTFSFSHCSSFALTTKAQVATISENLVKAQVSAISETLVAPVPTLPKRYSHLTDLVSQLSAGADVPSAMEPWLDKLTIHDWNALLLEFGGKDWNISWQILAFFSEKSPLLDQSLLREEREEEEALESSAEIALETLETTAETPEEAQKSTAEKEIISSTAEKAQETLASSAEENQEMLEVGSVEAEGTVDSGSEKSQETLEPSSEKLSPSLKLHTTLVRVLARNKRFEELDQLQVQMKDAGIEADASFYNALLDSYVDEGRVAKISEVQQEMKMAGFEPYRFTYEKIAYIHMNQETPDLDLPTEIMKDLMGRGLPVNVGIFKNLLKAHWKAKNIAGAEEVLQAMQVAGHTPDLKVLLKVMQLNGRKGNYERILELMQRMTKWGIQPNTGVYDCLLHAYCKAGLMEKAKETLTKYESVLNIKPTIIAFNMLLDGYGKKGLHEDALQIFEEIRKNGHRPNAVSYSTIISAMAQVEKFDKAAELYRRMRREKIQPNLHTYMTIIRCYTKRNWTREGHKIYNVMKKAPVQMTEAAYGTALALYVEGNWYRHAAALLKEIEKEEGVALDAAAHGLLIQSFGILENKLTPLARAVQESELEVCKLLTSLFITNLENQKLEPKLIEAVFLFLEKWKAESLEAQTFVYNAFLDCFWKKGLKDLAKRILGMAREVYAGYTQPQLHEMEWVLDVRGLSVGGAKAALIDWLTDLGDGKRVADDLKMVVITGDDFLLQVAQDNRVLKGALSSMLGELGSPFVESLQDSKKLEASAADVFKWVSTDKIKNAMNLADSH